MRGQIAPIARGRRRRVGLGLALTIGYLAVTLLMMRPMVDLARLGSACYAGDARLIVWTLAWDNHAILDRVPLFDANIFYPATSSLQYNEHLVGISLFTLPIYAATRNPILGYNLVWILSFVLNALAMHALAFRHTRSHAAAATAALIFTFSTYKMLHAGWHLAHIWTWLLPLSLWLLERWIDRPTPARAAAWGAAMILQGLGSWYVAAMTVLVNGLVIAWHAVTLRPAWPRRLGQMLAAMVVAAAVVGPFAWRYRALDPAPPAAIASLSADWAAYLVPAANTWPGHWWRAHIGPQPREVSGERTAFLGGVALVLAGHRVAARLPHVSRVVARCRLSVLLDAELAADRERIRPFGAARARSRDQPHERVSRSEQREDHARAGCGLRGPARRPLPGGRGRDRPGRNREP
jgi:hypothetical protein